MSGAGHAHLRELDDAVLQVHDLEVTFGSGRAPRVQAVSGVSFDIARGETLGIVGESGCGKSTTGRAIMQMPPATAGSVLFEGDDLGAMSPSELRLARTRVQMIFQDPISSLKPRRRVRD